MAQGMVQGQARMIEVRAGIVNHAQIFHYAARAHILGNCERDEAVEAGGLKSKADDRAGCFRGQAAAPVVEREAPANFHRGHERRVEGWNREADEPDERLPLKKFCGE